MSGSENDTLQLTGIEAARLVSTAVSTLGDPSSGQYAIIGGLAVLCRCKTAKRVTSDVDTVSAGMDRGALVSDKTMISGAGAEDDVKFDRIDPEPIEIAESSDPRQKLPVSIGRCFELLRAEDPATCVDHRCVMRIPMGIHPADDNRTILCHAVSTFSRGHAPVGGRTGQWWASVCAGSYEVTSVRSAACTANQNGQS